MGPGAEKAENPWRQENLPQFIVEADAFDKGCERQDLISRTAERKKIVEWLENYTAGGLHEDKIVANLVQALKRELGL